MFILLLILAAFLFALWLFRNGKAYKAYEYVSTRVGAFYQWIKRTCLVLLKNRK